MTTYLVTGGAGFIGSNYILYMLKKYGAQIRVINLDDLTYAGNLENLEEASGLPNYSFVKADICDRAAVESVFSDCGIDCVVHFAAESHVDRSIKSPDVFVRTNVLGTQTLLDAAKKSWERPQKAVESDGPAAGAKAAEAAETDGGGWAHGKKFVHVSTDEVYGALGATGFFTEETPLDPHSPYSATKAGSDLLVKAYWDTYRMPVNITRCSNNYGPYQFPEKLIPLIIRNALNGLALPVYGDGLQVRDWLYVGDHARAIDLVARNGRPGEVYNIGGNNEKFNIDIVRTIIATLRELLPDHDPRRAAVSEDLIRHVEDRKGHDRRYAIDAQKIRGALGWEPETDFSDGIRRTVRWYLEHEAWVQNVTSGAYVGYYQEMYGDRKEQSS
ncbi:MAG: dTDP-glucose 4,6-dehydratase [Clostridiales bacterium]|jgi:dTDP-glucose 4,6-dehydratase|nr:dTDP-glucose 4,6-dehydratase [Clostridiales bacterium]